MPSFAYPSPFQFGETSAAESSSRAPPRDRRAPGRAKSNDENFFTANPSLTKPQRGMGPKTKSGRVLPKPMPAPHRGGNQQAVRVGRSPPEHRGVGKTQSSNLEQMQAGARTRASSLPRKPQAVKHTEPDDYMESGKKPSSLKNFLLSPARNKPRSGKGGELQASLHSAPDLDSVNRKKTGPIKQLLATPLRKAPITKSKSADLEFMAVDSADLAEPEDREGSAKAKSRSKGSSSRRRRQADKDEDSSSKKDKPKTFKQLLGKKQPPERSKSEDLVDLRNTRSKSPPRARSPLRRPASPERELSLSPEQPKKPASLLTNLLDSLYDNYMDPKANKDDSEEFENLHASVSRFDMSISSLF